MTLYDYIIGISIGIGNIGVAFPEVLLVLKRIGISTELVLLLAFVFVLATLLVVDPLGTSSSHVLVDVLVLVLGHLGVAFPWILLGPFRHYQ